MRIQHNIMAMNAYRNYTNNVSAMKSNLEKLSSGYKINRAGDDAAGLAISEKMRAQITGLETAQKNAKDGISLVQTAEGALTEVHDMLNRMVELATQSANGTYDDTTDRNQMQKELDQLRTEINRIADSSNFNGIKLLDGSMGMNQDAFKLDGFTQAETGLVVSGALNWKPTKTDALTNVSQRGTNTILHKTGNAAQKGSFTIDLSQIEATAKASQTSIKIQINSVAITLTAADVAAKTGEKITGADIAKALAAKFDGTATTKALMVNKAGAVAVGAANTGALYYKAVDNSDGTVTFESYAYGSTSAAVTLTDGIPNNLVNTAALVSPNWSVALSNSATKWTIGDGKGVNTQNIKTTDIKGPSAGTPDQLASTIVTLDPAKIKDGSKIVIGDTTYTFALGKASGFKDADNVIDLTSGPFANIKSLSDITVNADKLQAASIITDAMGGNANFTVGNTGTAAAPSWDFSVFEKGDGTGKSGATADIQAKLATEAGFKDLVKVIDPDTPAATKLTVTESKIKDGNVITIAAGDVEKKYGFDDKKAGTTENGVTWLAKTGGKAALKNTLENDGFKVTVDDKGNWELSSSKGMVSVLGKGLTLQIGDTADDYNKLSVTIKDTHCNSLGIDATNMSIADQDSAGLAVDKIKAAINYISDIRGTLGATQNRLDHTINNLSVMTENIQDAESTIRDVDVAEEMMAYTKNNILIQSAQAMLAQANQVPQGVLQLLQ